MMCIIRRHKPDFAAIRLLVLAFTERIVFTRCYDTVNNWGCTLRGECSKKKKCDDEAKEETVEISIHKQAPRMGWFINRTALYCSKNGKEVAADDKVRGHSTNPA